MIMIQSNLPMNDVIVQVVTGTVGPRIGHPWLHGVAKITSEPFCHTCPVETFS